MVDILGPEKVRSASSPLLRWRSGDSLGVRWCIGAWAPLAAAVILAGCGGPAAPSTTTTDSTVASPSTSTTEPLVDVVAFEAGRPTLFDPGVTYRQDMLLLPLEVTFSEDGWRSDVSTEQLVAFLNTADGTSIASAVGIWVDDASSDDLVVSVSAIAETIVGPRPRVVGGVEGEIFDVRLEPRDVDPNNQRDHPCDNAWDFKADGGVGEISQYERKQLGQLAACGWSHLWIGSLGDGRVAVIGVSRFDASPNDPGQLADLAPYADDLFDAITFCTGPGTCS